MPAVKWRAMPRILPTQWPTVRIARGRSLGPMKISATTAIEQQFGRVDAEHRRTRGV